MTSVKISAASLVPVLVNIPPGLAYLLKRTRFFDEGKALTRLNNCSKERNDCDSCMLGSKCNQVFKDKIDSNIRFRGCRNVRRFIK